MNSNPNKAQQDWQDWCCDYGCSIGGGMGGPLSFHHIIGSKMKLQGFNDQKPGEWYGYCLSYWWHQDGRNPAARHISKHRFEREAGKTEKQMFIESVELYESIYGHKPMGEEIYQQLVKRA